MLALIHRSKIILVHSDLSLTGRDAIVNLGVSQSDIRVIEYASDESLVAQGFPRVNSYLMDPSGTTLGTYLHFSSGYGGDHGGANPDYLRGHPHTFYLVGVMLSFLKFDSYCVVSNGNFVVNMEHTSDHQVYLLQKLAFLYQCSFHLTARAGYTLAAFNQKYPEGIAPDEWTTYPLDITSTELIRRRTVAGTPTQQTASDYSAYVMQQCNALFNMNRNHPDYSTMMQSRTYRTAYFALHPADRSLPLHEVYRLVHQRRPDLCSFYRPSSKQRVILIYFDFTIF